MQLLHFRSLLAVGALSAILAGCGGGGSSPTPDNDGPFTIDGSLERTDFFDDDDDRYYDIFVTEPSRDGTAQVEMDSNDFDAQLFIYRRASDGDYDLIAEDDNGGDGDDSLVRFDVRRGQVYRVITTSANANAVGNYRAFFSDELGRPAVVLPRADSRTASGIKLPPIKAKATK